jgi:hypothetical protein
MRTGRLSPRITFFFQNCETGQKEVLTPMFGTVTVVGVSPSLSGVGQEAEAAVAGSETKQHFNC